MRTGLSIRLLVAGILAVGLAAGTTGLAQSPLAVDTGRVTIAGTSNIHEYTASTTNVRVTRAQLGAVQAGPGFWESVLKPGALQAFEISIPAATLTSPKDGLDKNMHKALKVEQHPEITFRLIRFEATGVTTRAIGLLTIAGVEHEVTMDISTKRSANGLAVQGHVDLLMTDYGITPPKAMLGMLKTDPKVSITFETVITVPLT
jgi:hypothetical protein